MDQTSGTGRRIHHTIGWIIGVTLLVWAVIFLVWLVYYLWQFKYGSTQELVKTQSEFSSGKFSSIKDSGEVPKAPSDWKTYIKSDNPTLGNPNSPITLVAFIDFECPFCQEDYPTLKSVLTTYGPAVHVVFKYLPLTSLHEHALAAAKAAVCAQEQNKFWPFYDYLFTTKRLTDDDLTAAAVAVHLDMQRFVDCQTSDRAQKIIETDLSDAVALGVRGTPTYFVNQDTFEGVTNRSAWDSSILRNFKK